MENLKDFNLNVNSVDDDNPDGPSARSLWTSATTIPCAIVASISALSALSTNYTVTGDPNYTENKCY